MADAFGAEGGTVPQMLAALAASPACAVVCSPNWQAQRKNRCKWFGRVGLLGATKANADDAVFTEFGYRVEGVHGAVDGGITYHIGDEVDSDGWNLVESHSNGAGDFADSKPVTGEIGG
jgi:hypothetical protein